LEITGPNMQYFLGITTFVYRLNKHSICTYKYTKHTILCIYYA